MSDKKYSSWLVLIGLLVIFLVIVFFVSSEKGRRNFWGNEIREVRIGENIFQAEIVNTPAERSQGLSGREELCENCAILFIFNEKGLHSFWMKEMNFDLDMIWIDENEVVHIAKNASHKKELEIIKPEREANKVLEINAGLSDKFGIKVGDKMEF